MGLVVHPVLIRHHWLWTIYIRFSE